MPIKMVLNKGKVPVKIYTEEVESSALNQLTNISQLPFVHDHIAAMPDVHTGIGATVGAVIPTKKAIIPAAVGVDIGCFVGETKVPLLNGNEATLQELAQKDGEHWIYAIGQDHKITGAKATAKLTRKNASLVKVVLDNDEVVICTPDHQFMLRNGYWCEAKDLKPDTSLMPFYSRLDKEGYRTVRQPATGKEQRVNLTLKYGDISGLQKLQQVKLYNFNHKVKSVEPVDYCADVYCLTVPDYANFALSTGVFVHNCGMSAVRLSLNAQQLPDNLKPIRAAIENAIPVGFDMHKSIAVPRSTISALNNGIEQILEKHPSVGKMIKRPHETWTQQLASLGGGNHFIEVCLDENQAVWIMLHSGSRGIGNVIGRYFIDLAKRDMETHMIHLPDKDLAYLNEGTQHFDDYVDAVHWAQDYAMTNRREMMRLLLEALRKALPHFELTKEVINCHHNYVSIEHHFGEQVYLTRKGAISAREGELGIIPGSMGAKSFIVKGKGDLESFHSCSHGAGRRMSRTQAKKAFTREDMIAQTQGIECRKDSDVIDEIPAAYKDIDVVMENQNDLVDIVHTLKQVVCVKG